MKCVGDKSSIVIRLARCETTCRRDRDRCFSLLLFIGYGVGPFKKYKGEIPNDGKRLESMWPYMKQQSASVVTARMSYATRQQCQKVRLDFLNN